MKAFRMTWQAVVNSGGSDSVPFGASSAMTFRVVTGSAGRASASAGAAFKCSIGSRSSPARVAAASCRIWRSVRSR